MQVRRKHNVLKHVADFTANTRTCTNHKVISIILCCFCKSVFWDLFSVELYEKNIVRLKRLN